jgi:hypothetical protein
MSTSYWEMHEAGIRLPPPKTHADCKSPGCYQAATFYSHTNIGWCDKHGRQLIVATVKAIEDGTHHALQAGAI